MTKLNFNSKIETIYASLEKKDGKIVIPANFKLWAGILIFALGIVKVFTNSKVDKIIDEIIEALRLIEN